MLVLELIPLGKQRTKIIVEGGISFVLYRKEIHTYKIELDQDLPEQTYQAILQEVLIPRAKKRALHLLEKMARTESGLRTKLHEGGYPQEVIDAALAYVKGFGYINDEAYAQSFLLAKQSQKSAKQLQQLMYQRGLDKALIEEVLESSHSEEAEREAIRKMIAKKRIDLAAADRQEIQKLFQSLARRGFSYDLIREELQVRDSE